MSVKVKPIISIIVPVYKVELYLRECLDSVLVQTFTDYECILVDDGSPDTCPAICDEYVAKYPKMRAIHKANGGLSDARNVGIQQASGEWIYFLDSDDKLFDQNVLTNLSNLMEETSNSVIFCPYLIRFNSNNKATCKTVFPKNIINCTSQSFFRLCAKSKISLCAPLFIIKKALLVKENLFFEINLLHEDMEWIPRVLISSDNITVCHVPCYLYRIDNENSITSCFSEKRFFDLIKIIDKYNDRIKILNRRMGERKILSAWLGMLYFILLMHMSNLLLENNKLYKKYLNVLYQYALVLLYNFTCRNYLLYFSIKTLNINNAIYILTILRKILRKANERL
jgi:glycosyltransferase involved in cell wall biosynthesis